jgi:hypothetical protein
MSGCLDLYLMTFDSGAKEGLQWGRGRAGKLALKIYTYDFLRKNT